MTSKATLADLSVFDVHPDRGFLPAEDPLQVLPPRFAAWEEIAIGMPKLLMTDQLRKLVDQLPAFEIGALSGARELERAMVILSYIGQSYVWGYAAPAKTVPANLAVPWYDLAKKLGRLPVLSYASYALHNWRRIDPSRAIELGNIALLQNFLGGMDEEWFILIHVAIEAKAAPAIYGLAGAQLAAQAGDAATTRQKLEIASRSIGEITAILERMPECCDPYIYFNRVRPYIHGWKNNPALPDGLIYEGVSAYGGKPQQLRGETGAQSSIIPCFDAALGVEHKNDPLKEYLLEMRDYMPAKHRALIEAMEQAGSVRKFVEQEKDTALTAAYDSCIEWVTKFRSVHLKYASEYIFKQHQKSLSNPSAVGTGGTPFIPYLTKHRDETDEHKL